MSLRLVPRTLGLAHTRIGANVPRSAVLVRQYATSQPKENPTSSAEQTSTSAPPAPKEVPLTAKSHGPFKQNTNLAGKVGCVFEVENSLSVVFSSN
jgi:hypothetical protein